MHIKELHKEYRPREKAKLNGITSLSNAELLALFIGTGTKKVGVYEIAHKLLSKYHNLYFLSKSDLRELMKNDGIGETKALELLGVFEISTRINGFQGPKIANDASAAAYATKIIGHGKQEAFLILILNERNEVCFQKILTVGLEDEMSLSGRVILSELLKQNARKFYCFHNHPSGIVKPSSEDIMMTESLQYYCSIFGIKLFNHIIVNSKGDYNVVVI